MFARLKARGAVAAVLVSALVAGGAFVGGGAAYAAEPEPTAVSEAPAVSTEETTPAVEAETAPAAGETSSPEVTEGDAQNESADQGSDAAPAEDAGAATEEAPATDAEDAAAEEDKAVTTEKPAAKTAARAAKAALPESLEALRENGGALTWDFKSSFISYITMFGGSVSAYGGATAADKGVITFPESAESNYDSKTNTGEIAYTGGVVWDNPAHGFTIAMQNVRITVAANGSAVVSAEMSTSDTVGASDVARVDIATISTLGEVAAADEKLSWSKVAATFVNPLTPGGLSNYNGAAASPMNFSTSNPVVPEKTWTPEVQVFLNGSTKPLEAGAKVYKDDVLTIKGTGFDPESNVGGYGRPIPNTLPQGNYVVFGKFGSSWKPSENAPSSQRAIGAQAWALSETVLNKLDEETQKTIRAQWANIAEDGSWTATLTLADSSKAAAVLDGSYGVFTYAAGGVKNSEQELDLRLDYQDKTRAEIPTIEVFRGDIKLAAGDKVYKDDVLTIKGTGFDPESNVGGYGRPIPNTLPQGHYVVFGKFGSSWKPSENAPSSQRAIGAQAWALSETVLNKLDEETQKTIRAQWANIAEDGSWTATLTLADSSKAAAVLDGSYGVFTYAAGGVKNSEQELKFALNYTDEAAPVEPEPEPEPAFGGLQWGIKDTFISYVEGPIGGGTIKQSKTVTRTGDIFGFPQMAGGTWNAKNATGEVRFAGSLEFSAHNGGLSRLLQDPIITVKNDKNAVLTAVVFNKDNSGTERIAIADIVLPKKVTNKDGSVTWVKAKTVLRAGAVHLFLNYDAGEELDPVTFTVGKAKDVKPTTPTKPTKPVVKPTEKPKPIVVPQNNSKQPGSLTWGVSSGFAGYTTGKIAKGSVTSDGVGRSGGAYVFPQASSSWNTASQTGTVQFSGVVTFTGHNGAMVETFSNPVITVNSASSATMNAGGRTFTLDLGSASKVVGSNGEVTWSGVPVGGVISGGGSAGGGSGAGSFSADPLSFTVGAANGTSYGSTEQTAPSTKRTAADAPPATTGITLITDKKKLVAGAEVEFEASGFEPNERDILVVVYSDPIVLDDAAGADENGVVRWIGNLPKDLKPGEHTLTLQGSKNAGVKITVLSKEEAKKAKATADNEIVTAQSASVEKAAAGDLAATGSMLWLWWTAAILLLILAVVGAALVVRQRRTIE